jgi:hypothetical protein
MRLRPEHREIVTQRQPLQYVVVLVYCTPGQSDHQDDILSSSQMTRWS